MSRIAIFGNVVKDVYLDLIGNEDDFETDENNTEWMNVGFDGSKHYISDRTAFFGGAKITEEVFSNFGFDAEIISKSEVEYRYILCREQKISYFVQKKKKNTEFVEPDSDTRMLVIDRSAGITRNLIEKIKKFHKERPEVLIISHIGKNSDELSKELAEMSNLCFLETEQLKSGKGRKCFITREGIKLGESEVSWKLRKEDMMTHLTIFSIAMATVVAGILRGKSAEEALEFARVNVENAQMNKSLTYEEIQRIIDDENHSAMDLKRMAKMIVARGKGILAVDESSETLGKRFAEVEIANTEKNRREYRNLLLATENLGNYINAVIISEETARQKAEDGRNLVEYLTNRGIIAGIKADGGLKDLPAAPGVKICEKYTDGLDGIEEKLSEYYLMGLRFAKWRAVFEVSETTPSDFAVIKNCEILAEFAKKCQEAKLVPMVEPEVVFDGEYNMDVAKAVNTKILYEIFEALERAKVDYEAMILKINMCMAGKKWKAQSIAKEVGEETAELIKKFVPENVAGVAFLSGGQESKKAIRNLHEIIKNGPYEYPVTFAFARALQEPALTEWQGLAKNKKLAQKEFTDRLEEAQKALKSRKK